MTETRPPWLKLPDTPALDFLWAPSLEAYAPSKSIPTLSQYERPLPLGIEASHRCSACSGSGRPRRTRDRSPAPGAAQKRLARRGWHFDEVCNPCNGYGWIGYDARPHNAVGEGGRQANSLRTDSDGVHGLNTGHALVEASAPFEFIPEVELQRWRAKKACGKQVNIVGDAWARRFEDAHAYLTTLRFPLACLWPLTEHGRRAAALREGPALAPLLEHADLGAVALLGQAEARAAGAVAAFVPHRRLFGLQT